MPFAACDRCERVFVTSTEIDPSTTCLMCCGHLRPMTPEEAHVNFLQRWQPEGRLLLPPEENERNVRLQNNHPSAER